MRAGGLRSGLCASVIVLAVTALFYVVGYATPVWTAVTSQVNRPYDQQLGIQSTEHVFKTTHGLWQNCLDGLCESVFMHGSVLAWLKAAQGLASVSLLGIALAGIIGVLRLLLGPSSREKNINRAYLATLAFSFFFGTLGVAVYLAQGLEQANAGDLMPIHGVHYEVLHQQVMLGYSSILILIALIGILTAFLVGLVDAARSAI